MSFGKLISDQFAGVAKELQQGSDSVRQALGLASGSAVGGSSPNIVPPWVSEASPSSFFTPIDIKGDRWNKLYPYRLAVIDVNNGNKVVSKKGSVAAKGKAVAGPKGSARILFESIGNVWEFRLPVTPQQLQIVTPYSIGVTSTLRGITEEHNGVKFKMINCQGTFGVWPYKPAKSSIPDSPTSLQSLFGGSIQGVNDTLNQVAGVIRSINSNHPAAKPTVTSPEKTSEGYQGTGYAQAMLLDQFLEQYAEAKKDHKNAGYRLVFDIPKQNQAFMVTPAQFTWSQSIENPNEIRYQFQLKAWRRINLGDTPATPDPSIPALQANNLQKVLRAVEFSRRTLGASLNLIKAVRSDFRTPFEILRQTSLFVKDLIGVGATAIDLPGQILSDIKSSVKDSLSLLTQDSIAATPVGSGSNVFQKQSSKSLLQDIGKAKLDQEGLSDSAVDAGQLGADFARSKLTDPTNAIFNSPEENFDLFNSVIIRDLSLSPQAQRTIDDQIASISLLTVDDLIQYRETLLELSLQISNAFGTGDQFFSDIYDRPDPYQRVQEITIDEYAVLGALYDTIQSMDILTATQELDDEKIQNALDFVGQLAEESGIPFESSTAKILVPVPFGLTIEQLAARYTGDPDKWLEIVTLNALKEPYLDETGFTYSLLSNADGRQLNIPSKENLYIGQKIVVQSNTQPPTSRRIIDIERINDTNFLLTLDGLDNLDSYTTSAQARIRAYLPGTVNSQNQIFVPSDGIPPNDVRSRPVPAFQSDPLVGLSKVDILLTDDGDVATNAYGEFRLSGGLTNLIQALRMKFVTQAGKLIKHPNYGAGIQPGSSSADFSASNVVDEIFRAVQEDPRFETLDRMEVRLDGPVLEISMSVRIANGNGILPITFRAA